MIKISTYVILSWILQQNLLFAAKYQLPLESIFYIGEMSQNDFRSLYPGKVISGPEQELSEGYYLVYEHESLFYFFGPAKNPSLLSGYKEVLDNIVVQVKNKRPSLDSAKTYFFPEIQPKNKKNEQKPVYETPISTPIIKPWWETIIDIFGW